MEFCLEKPLSSSCLRGVSAKAQQLQQDYQDDDEGSHTSLLLLFSTEKDHMLDVQYLTSLKDGEFSDSICRDAISSVSRLSSGSNPLLSYLAINYLNRFLSSQRLKRAEPWVSRLLALSCLSLAAKMLGVEVPCSLVQGNDGLIHDSRTIHRMEFLILGALGWRMRSVTPFSFLPFFSTLFELKDEPSRRALRARAIEIILGAQHDVEMLRFKPSLVAASALLSASFELFPVQFQQFRTVIHSCSYVNEEELAECYGATQEVVTEGYESAVVELSGPDTPQNMPDQQFSYTSSSSSSADEVILGCSRDRSPKKRKMDGLLVTGL
ncbi:hypothetical protein MLD38_029297 [Melastoma candidum]|uniref:Uncharacterized protein n=1 Tax=Melastoma candidum TaxID=119954 RepID=A0ACB9N5T5_9MYRT|nr:hypothetical protein MLD38_029297 [Melastoma candidum]